MVRPSKEDPRRSPGLPAEDVRVPAPSRGLRPDVDAGPPGARARSRTGAGRQLREIAGRLEVLASPPAGTGERSWVYAVMGLPFRSGHVLAMRRVPVTSVGPGHTSVWHRDPEGRWTFYTSVALRLGCPRYFGSAAARAIETGITIDWTGPDRFEVRIPAARLEWSLVARETPMARAMNAFASIVPDAAWRSRALLSMTGAAAGPLLGAGRLGLVGRVPNGQGFMAIPRVMAMIVATRASIGGEDLGEAGPVRPQARLGDFWIPQRGILAVGHTHFDVFDPDRHSARTSQP